MRSANRAPTKRECESAIRHLCGQWRKLDDVKETPNIELSYSSFKRWAEQQGYSHYFKFRSVTGADYDAEMWFDDEFNLNWTR